MTEPRTVKDWENEVAALTNQELADYEKALETLAKWENFEKAFGPSKSLACLRQIIGQTRTVRMVHFVSDQIKKSAERNAELVPTVEVRKTSLGNWNNGRTSATSNCYYTGKSPCYGIWINDVKTIAFRRSCDAGYFKQFAEDTGYVDKGDPEMLFYKWLTKNKMKDPSSSLNKPYDLDKIKVVG